MPFLQVESYPKQVNKFDMNQQIHQVDFSRKKDLVNVSRHSIYENWMIGKLEKILEDTQIFILICFVGSFLTVAFGLCCVKLCEEALRTFYGVRNELQEVLRTSNQTV